MLIQKFDLLSISKKNVSGFTLNETPLGPRIGIYLKGAFYENIQGNATNFLYLYVELEDELGNIENVTTIHQMTVIYTEEIDHVEETASHIVLDIYDEAFAKLQNENAVLRLQMYTNIDTGLPLLYAYDPAPINKGLSVIYAALVLLGLYVLIVWDVVHRTFAAIIASTLALSVLAILHHKPTMEEVISWIDVETLLLLFGMMVLVAILSETGIFDFLAVYAYKVKMWRRWGHRINVVINCLFTIFHVDYKGQSVAVNKLSGLIYCDLISIFGQCHNHSINDTSYDKTV